MSALEVRMMTCVNCGRNTRPSADGRVCVHCQKLVHECECSPLWEIISQTDAKTLSERKKDQEFACIPPSVELLKETASSLKVLESHPWRVIKSEPYGSDLPSGVLSEFVCSDCGLERMMIMPNVRESSRKAHEYRRKRSAKPPQGTFFACITPTVDMLQSMESVYRVLQSHVWDVDRSEPYGADGILLSVHCPNCTLERIMLISEIEYSAKRAEEKRQASYTKG